MNNFIRTFLYGNIYYGVCTVALSIESNLLHGISLNSYRFYILIFLATIVYYSRIYYRSSVVASDDRTRWYKANKPLIKNVLLILFAIIIIDIIYIAFLNMHVLLQMSLYYWILLAVVPVLGLMYTFQVFPFKRLRRVGWLKPFIIGFVWAGVVTIFPVLFWQIRHPNEAIPGLPAKTLIWLQNFLFISVLAIIFDIKDQKVDRRHKLQTYPAKYGISISLRYIILPITLLSFFSMIFFHFHFKNPTSYIFIQSIPYVLLFLITQNFTKERNLLFYLAVVDGLMLVKAFCGIISISFF